jgi:hypothetical protein
MQSLRSIISKRQFQSGAKKREIIVKPVMILHLLVHRLLPVGRRRVDSWLQPAPNLGPIVPGCPGSDSVRSNVWEMKAMSNSCMISYAINAGNNSLQSSCCIMQRLLFKMKQKSGLESITARMEDPHFGWNQTNISFLSYAAISFSFEL